MTLVKFNNHPAVKRFFDEDVFNNFNESFFTGFPPVNIYDHKDHYAIEVAAPGREKADFKIQVDKNILTVSQEKKEPTETAGEVRQVRKEFGLKTFKRSFTLDEKIDVEGIVAKYENGILKLTLPKKEVTKESSKDIAVL